MNRIFSATFVILVLVGCTLQPTPIPISEINLEHIAIQSGDLPPGYSASQVRLNPPPMFDGMPEAQNTFAQAFESNDEVAGGVTIFLYSSEETLRVAYREILYGFDNQSKPVTEVGEEADIVAVDSGIFQFTDLVFTRCSAVVHIRMGMTSDKDYALSYGKRLDDRLKAWVCP